jgi:hypothetical protein
MGRGLCASRKEGLFRDIISSEYDPFKHTRRSSAPASAAAGSGSGSGSGSGGVAWDGAGPVTYSTAHIKDPLKQDIVRVEQERRILEAGASPTSPSAAATSSSSSSILKPVLRSGLDILLWNKLESTPHGRYAKMFAEEADRAAAGLPHAAPPPTNAAAATRSTLTMDHYKYTTSLHFTSLHVTQHPTNPSTAQRLPLPRHSPLPLSFPSSRFAAPLFCWRCSESEWRVFVFVFVCGVV